MRNIFYSILILWLHSQYLISAQNITISELLIDGPVHDIVWCGQEEISGLFDPNASEPIYMKKIVFVVSGKGTVYRSINEGRKWENMRPQFETELKNFGTRKDDKKFGSILKIYTSEADQKFVLFHGPNGLSFVSQDCGESIKIIEHDEEINEFKLNPIDKNFILASSKKKCGENDPEYCSILMNVYYTDKMGMDWKNMQTSVIEYSWACTNKFYKHLIPVERVIVTKAVEESKPTELKTRILYSDNFFLNYIIISPKGYRFFMTTEFLYVLEVEDIIEKKFSLKICPNYYREYKLSSVELPIQRLKDHSFTILDSTETSIFINVNHYGDEAKFGNVYVSNYEGKRFVLSLLHNVRDDKGFCDFDRVKSLEGVYIANHYEHIEAEKFKSNYNYYNQPNEKSLVQDKIDSYKKSVISYDKGGYWYPIPAPEKDIDGKTLDCHGECSLHLRGFTDKYSNPLYSSETSIGIVMGVGNTGIYLSQKPEEVNTYLSRDGGHSWIQVDKGSYIYEIGDHGGLIVMADDTKPTKTLKYSWNEGISWEYFTFSEEEIDITNIIIEPMNMSLKFLIYGKKATSTGVFEGVIILVDFSTLKKRVCSGIWNPGSEESDYEVWVPGSHDQGKCLFGKRMKYVRRKRNADCFNGEDYEKKSIVDFCPCSEEDWECDYGFYRKIDSNECVPISSEFEHRINNFTEPENCTDFYEVPSGYRKVPGDFCIGGVDKGVARQVRCSKFQDNFDMNRYPPGYRQSSISKAQESEDVSFLRKYLKFELFAILVVILLIIFKERAIDFLIFLIKMVKKINFWSKIGKNDKKPSEYERVGAPLKSMNDEDDDEDNT